MNDKLTKRVAVFRNVKHGFDAVRCLYEGQADEDYTAGDDYVRVSEWMDAEFKPLTDGDIAGTQIVALTKLRKQTVNEFKQKLDYIDGKIANLRALSGPSVSP